MIQDIHAHLFHPNWYPTRFQDAIVRDFQRRQKQTGAVNGDSLGGRLLKMLRDETGEITLRIMDKVGIEKRAILVLDWGIELGEPEKSIWEIHEDILRVCRRYADRFVGFAGVDPRREDAVELITQAFEALGAAGLKLHPTGGWKLTDERTLAAVAVAARRGAPVLVHLGKTVDVLDDINAQPTPFLDLARKFPEIPFIAGHSGFDLWKLFVEIAETVPPNVFFDVSGWQERAQGDGDNIVSDLRKLAAAFPGHVCFGTDSPFYSFNLSQSEQKWKDKMEPVLPGQWATLDSLLDYTTRNPIPAHRMIARASAKI